MFEFERTQIPFSVTHSTLTVRPNHSIILYADEVDKRELSEDEKRTQEYDQLAFRLVSYGAIPVLAGYTGYSRTSLLKLEVRAEIQSCTRLIEDGTLSSLLPLLRPSTCLVSSSLYPS
jgi:hypothetical protein